MTDLEQHGSSGHQAGHRAAVTRATATPGSLVGLSTKTEHPARAQIKCTNGEQDIVR